VAEPYIVFRRDLVEIDVHEVLEGHERVVD
jgi:hypothetical protein